MSPVALYFLLLSLLVSLAGFYLYFTSQKNELNRIYFALALFWAYLHLIEFGLRTCESAEMAVAWSLLGALRFTVLPLMLHFMLVYSGRCDVWRAWVVDGVLYVPVVAFAAIEVAGLLSWYKPVHVAGTWFFDRNNLPVTGLLTGWGLTVCALTLLAGVTLQASTRSGAINKPRFFTGMLAALAIIGMTTWVLDSLTMAFPGVLAINGLTVMGAFTVFIYRYNFFSVSPATAAEDVINAIPDALLITTVEGGVERLNPMAEELTGHQGADAVRLHIDTLFGEGFAHLIFGKAVSSERNIWTQESMLRTKPGAEIPVVVNVSLIRKTKKNIPVAMVISCHDSTFEKKALDEFRKTEQLEALGFLAGGIAHDFNNLLTSIVAYLSLAKTTEEISDSMRQKLDKVDSAAHLVIDLNRQLAAISKGAKPNKEQCSLKEILASAVQLALSGSSIECHSSIPDDLHSIEADASQISQVFLNLLVNARQAMDHGGVVGVRCANCSIDGASWVEVAITDQGSGITAPNIDDIFKPFYTTKERGTGLGLSVVRSVVEKHGGTIGVSTRKGIGTTFTVRLPAGEHAITAPPVQIAEEACGSVPSVGKILVMDDEEGVRRAINLMLADKGHTVFGVEHGAAAIAAYLKQRSEGAPFDLLILDVTVRNGYGAQEVIKRLREIDPAVKAVVMSGYRENALMKDPHAFGFIDVIPKPFDARQIYRVVNKALGARSVAAA